MHLFREVKFTAEHSSTIRMQRLLQLLEQPHSQIAPYVQSLHLRDAFWEPGLPKIFGFLSNLRGLHLGMRPGTASWEALPPALTDALCRTAALGTLEEMSVRNLSDVPAALFGLAVNLQRLVVCDTTLAPDDAELNSVPHGRRTSQLHQLKSLSVRGAPSLFIPAYQSVIAQHRPRISEVQLVAASREDVDVCKSFLRWASPSIEKLNFSSSNRTGESSIFLNTKLSLMRPTDIALLPIQASDYPILRHAILEVGTTSQDSPAGLTPDLLAFLSSISPSSSIHSLNIKIRWCSCNPDAPWNSQLLTDSWAKVDRTLVQVRALRSVTVTFIVSYSNGKGIWTLEDISSIERASRSLDRHLPSLLHRTMSRPDVQVRVVRESW
jgi:hypothetical protein